MNLYLGCTAFKTLQWKLHQIWIFFTIPDFRLVSHIRLLLLMIQCIYNLYDLDLPHAKATILYFINEVTVWKRFHTKVELMLYNLTHSCWSCKALPCIKLIPIFIMPFFPTVLAVLWDANENRFSNEHISKLFSNGNKLLQDLKKCNLQRFFSTESEVFTLQRVWGI